MHDTISSRILFSWTLVKPWLLASATKPVPILCACLGRYFNYLLHRLHQGYTWPKALRLAPAVTTLRAGM